MTRQILYFGVWILILAPRLGSGSGTALPQGVSFSGRISPLLATKCQGCHTASMKSGGLVTTSYADFKMGGRHGSPFVPGRPEQSLVLQHLTGERQPRMPMGMDPLPPSEIELFREWIKDGAIDDGHGSSEADPIPTAPPVYQASPVITALAFSPDGKLLAVSGNHEIVLHDTQGGEIVGRLVGRAERIHSLVFSADGTILVAVGGSPSQFGEYQVWEMPSGRLLRAVKVSSDTLFGGSLSPDGRYLAFGCADKTIRVHEVQTGEEVRRMENHADWVFGTAFSVDGKRLVSVSRDHFLKLSDVTTGAFVENLNLLTKATFGGQGELYALARHPKADVVVAAGDDRTPRMYTLHRPRAMKIDDDSCLLREFETQEGPVQCVQYSPDGVYVAVAGMGPEIAVYSAGTGDKIAALGGHRGGVYALSFHPSGGRLAAAGFDGLVRIYDLPSRRTLREFVPVPLVIETTSPHAHKERE